MFGEDLRLLFNRTFKFCCRCHSKQTKCWIIFLRLWQNHHFKKKQKQKKPWEVEKTHTRKHTLVISAELACSKPRTWSQRSCLVPRQDYVVVLHLWFSCFYSDTEPHSFHQKLQTCTFLEACKPTDRFTAKRSHRRPLRCSRLLWMWAAIKKQDKCWLLAVFLKCFRALCNHRHVAGMRGWSWPLPQIWAH